MTTHTDRRVAEDGFSDQQRGRLVRSMTFTWRLVLVPLFVVPHAWLMAVGILVAVISLRRGKRIPPAEA